VLTDTIWLVKYIEAQIFRISGNVGQSGTFVTPSGR